MDENKLWESLLSQIQFCVSKANFETWFKNARVLSNKNGVVTISVSNSFVKEWLEKKYNHLILKILRGTEKSIKRVEYLVEGKNPEPITLTKTAKKELPQLTFKDLEINKETNLNPRYSFNNFVVGSFNELAYAAAINITQNPGLNYNPLFIYGGVGLGKTHLLQAIGNKILENFPDKKVLYTPSDRFVSEIIDSIKSQSIKTLKTKLQKLDVLIIDDIQFISGKEKTQEEFFHLFNGLYQKNKQVVLSSDRPPKAIPALEERLRSRFEGGMIADIGLPDYETRLAILKLKAQEKNAVIKDEIFEYIASNITKNIRELEGALNQIIVYQTVNNKPANLETAKKLLKKFVVSPSRLITQEKIIKKIGEFYGINEKDLFGKTRKKEVVVPRQVAMYLLREELKMSFSSIGRKFNHKDHSTVIHAYNKINEELKKNSRLNEEIELIKHEIYSG
jgi:chromosomal replication initiator protein